MKDSECGTLSESNSGASKNFSSKKSAIRLGHRNEANEKYVKTFFDWVRKSKGRWFLLHNFQRLEFRCRIEVLWNLVSARAVKGKQCGTCATSCTGYWTTEYQRWRLWPNCMDTPKGKNLAKDYNGSRPLSIILTLPSTLYIFPMRISLTKSLHRVSLSLVLEGSTGLRVLGIWASLHVRNYSPANACLCG